jgi:hypothetical protein
MEFKKFVRTQFLVEAIEITEENFQEVADLIGVVKTEKGVTYIELNRRIIPNMYKAYLGWWLTKMDNRVRVYSPKTFERQFAEASADDILWHDAQKNAKEFIISQELDDMVPETVPQMLAVDED